MCSLDMKGYGADDICKPSIGIISFRMTSCSPSADGSPTLASSLRKAAMEFCPKYRDSVESSSSTEKLVETLWLVLRSNRKSMGHYSCLLVMAGQIVASICQRR